MHDSYSSDHDQRSRSSSPPVPASSLSLSSYEDSNRADTGLIGTLLGIRDSTVIDQVLQAKSPEDAAKMLGIKSSN